VKHLEFGGAEHSQPPVVHQVMRKLVVVSGGDSGL